MRGKGYRNVWASPWNIAREMERRTMLLKRVLAIFIVMLLVILLLSSVLWTASYEFISHVATHVSPPRKFRVPSLAEKVRTATGCVRYVNVMVNGKQLEKCIPATLPGTQRSIFFTIKTGQNYHKTRILTILLTWLQTVHPEQVSVCTNNI